MSLTLWGETIIPTFKTAKYVVGQTAVIICDQNGEDYGRITCAIPGADINENEIIVKTWSENTWVPQLLVERPDLFQDTGKRIPTGYVEAQVWTFDKTKI